MAKERNELENPTPARFEDHVNRAMKAGVSLILPAPLMEYFQWIVGDPAQERRDDFIQSIYERLRSLETEFDDFQPVRLRENAAFQATFLQASQIAARTINKEKLEMLQNAILNSAISHNLDENIRQIFLQYIERFTPMHAALLKLLDEPEANEVVKRRLETTSLGGLGMIVEIGIPALKGRVDIAQMLAVDLEAANLLSGGGLNVTMSAQGLRTRRTTALGRRFLAFVADPQLESRKGD